MIDTVEKATFVSLDVANSQRNIEEIADYTYVHMFIWNPQAIIQSMYPNAALGYYNSRIFSLAAGRASSRWSGQSFDEDFR